MEKPNPGEIVRADVMVWVAQQETALADIRALVAANALYEEERVAVTRSIMANYKPHRGRPAQYVTWAREVLGLA